MYSKTIFAAALLALTVLKGVTAVTACKITGNSTTWNELNINILCDGTITNEDLDFLATRSNPVSLTLTNIHTDEVMQKLTYHGNVILKGIKSVVVTNCNIAKLPEQIYLMENTELIDVSNNQRIKVVELDRFLKTQSLIDIKVHHNGIVQLGSFYNVPLRPSKSVNFMELNNNFIEGIPNNIFKYYTNLIVLNLSHNSISNLNVYSFDGLGKLQSLDLSYNRITQLSHELSSLVNLKTITLSNNEMFSLNRNIFQFTPLLTKVNLSYNKINSIESGTFHSLAYLQQLDLRYNYINSLPEMLFVNNIYMNKLLLSQNALVIPQGGWFETNNITEFSGNNAFNGDVKMDTFKGLHVNKLDLSGGGIRRLEDFAFTSQGDDLKYLNLSKNSINFISETAFISLHRLNVLDLNDNNLETLNFETTDLGNLKVLQVVNNKLRAVWKSTFQRLDSLRKLDLSNNSLVFNNYVNGASKSDVFGNLKKLTDLTLSYNSLGSAIDKSLLSGLVSLEKITLDNTGVKVFKNNSFSDLKSLKFITASNGVLNMIEYNAFVDLSEIEYITLSHNSLGTFHVNTSAIGNVRKLYLQYNKLKYIQMSTFSGLNLLEELDVSNNQIIHIDKYSFANVHSLNILDLSHNSLSRIITNAFDNVNLTLLSLHHTDFVYNFENDDVTIVTLDLSFSRIHNLADMHLHNIKQLSSLFLNNNLLKSIDRYSFGKNPSLQLLDLSMNHISYISPGTFMGTEYLENLKLNNNQINGLKYGALEGLVHLKHLNLSHNYITELKEDQFYKTPSLTNLYLDNNSIKYFDPKNLNYTNLKVLSIGSTDIPCEVFTKLHLSNFNQFQITAESLSYYTENVDGVECNVQ